MSTKLVYFVLFTVPLEFITCAFRDVCTPKHVVLLQVVVSRMRTISNQMGEGNAIRIVGLCTSLANAKDLGEWIGATSHGLYNFPPGTLSLQA